MVVTVAIFKAQSEVQPSNKFQNFAVRTSEPLFEAPIVYLKYSKTPNSSEVTE